MNVLRISFDVQVDADNVREIIKRNIGEVKPGQEEHVATLLSNESIACALKASVELAIPQIVNITERNLTVLISAYCDTEKEKEPSNLN